MHYKECSIELIPIPDRYVREWGAFSVVFDHRNGETLVLEGIVRKVFALLRKGPQSRSALIAEVGTHSHGDPLEAEASVSSILSEFQRYQFLNQSLHHGA